MAALPVEGGVVLSLEQMNRIIEIDTENLTAVVEPGVVNVDLQIEAEKHGLFFPPDPSSLKFCTIWGEHRRVRRRAPRGEVRCHQGLHPLP